MTTQPTQTPINDNIMQELTKIRHDLKEESWVARAAFVAQFVVIGLVLTLTTACLSKPYLFGWSLVVIGIVGLVFCGCKWRRNGA